MKNASVSRALAVALASVASQLVVTPATAAPAASADEAGVTRLYARADALYRGGELRDAADAWVACYRSISGGPEFTELRAHVLLSASRAELEAFDARDSRPRLEALRRLLEQFGSRLGDGDEEVRRAIDTEIARIDEKLPVPKEELPTPGFEAQASRVDQPKPQPLVIAGATTLGAGVALLGVMAAGLAVGAKAEADGEEATQIDGLPPDELGTRVDEAVRRGRLGNGLAIAGGIAGGVLVAIGIPMLAVGLKKKRKQVAFTPLLGPAVAGARAQVRF